MPYQVFNLEFDPSELFEDGLMHPPHDYKTDMYSYKLNSDGFRSVEFSEKPNVLTLGCSCTFGTGLPEKLTWPSQLQGLLGDNYLVGNLGDHGSSIMKAVSHFFLYIKKYNYLPEYLLCNFPDFERFYFINDYLDKMNNKYWVNDNLKTKDKAPFNWEKIIPVQWINWSNLDHIKMLEQFCYFTGIKMVWTSWSNNIEPSLDECLNQEFMFYKKDPTKIIFGSQFEFGDFNRTTLKDLENVYKMDGYDEILCHQEIKDKNSEVFHHAYDHGNVEPPFAPHPGSHKNAHWADFFYKEMNIKP
jgi:hypothetical protein